MAKVGKFLALMVASANAKRAEHSSNLEPQEPIMISEAITTAPPVLAAGWALLYMLFGGGLGGAALIFFGLKLIGR